MEKYKFYIDKKNKWGIVIENDKFKKYIAVPPTNGDRFDLINFENEEIFKGYNYNIKTCLLIEIKKGEIIDLKIID